MHQTISQTRQPKFSTKSRRQCAKTLSERGAEFANGTVTASLSDVVDGFFSALQQTHGHLHARLSNTGCQAVVFNSQASLQTGRAQVKSLGHALASPLVSGVLCDQSMHPFCPTQLHTGSEHNATTAQCQQNLLHTVLLDFFGFCSQALQVWSKQSIRGAESVTF